MKVGKNTIPFPSNTKGRLFVKKNDISSPFNDFDLTHLKNIIAFKNVGRKPVF